MGEHRGDGLVKLRRDLAPLGHLRRPSKVFEDQTRSGRVAAIALPGAVPLRGGLPVIFEGKVIGAVGGSGNPPQEDEDIAAAGVAALADAVREAKQGGSASNPPGSAARAASRARAFPRRSAGCTSATSRREVTPAATPS